MAMELNVARRLWRVVRAVLLMLRKGMPNKWKLAMDLHLLVHHGKFAGKALGNLMTAHGHKHNSHHDKAATAADVAPPQQFSCGRRRAIDPSLAVVYDLRGTREVEFSCSNTPNYSYPSLHLIPTGKRRSYILEKLPDVSGPDLEETGRYRRRRNNSRHGTHRGANGAEPGWYNYDAADIARVFEILNSNEQLPSGGGNDVTSDKPSPLALIVTPSPALWASFGGRTPSPLRDGAAGGDGGQVDLDAEEFIRKFCEQLRMQQSLAAATPDYYGGYAQPVSGIA